MTDSRRGIDAAIGDRVRFAPNPRYPTKLIEAEVVARRNDPRLASMRKAPFSRNFGPGWLDTRDDSGVVRSVLPSRCMILVRAEAGHG